MRHALSLFAVLCLCSATLPAYAAPLNVCFVSGSFEYKSDEALGIFKTWLEKNAEVNCTLLCASGWDNIPGLEALDSCDAALFFTRRLELSGEQLGRIKKYCDAGRPFVAVRTASHGFQKWLAFDREVLGGDYKGHFDEGPTIETFVMPDGKNHPILEGVETFRSRYSLYKNPSIAEDATVLMTGRTPDSGGRQPIAWIHPHKGRNVFYTSLGGVGDFESGAFCRMVANALFWTARRTPAFKTRHGLPEPPEKRDGILHLAMRTRAADAPNGAPGETITRDWPVAETAVIICDMWDKHWCDFASERVAAMAPKVNDLIKQARAAGVQIIHCPSETMGFYQGTVQRWRMQLPRCEPPKLLEIKEPPLPIDDSDGGCPDDQKVCLAWTRQHPAIEIAEEDCIEDDGGIVYSYLAYSRIKNVIYAGVHTNMCVLGRSFGIRQMTRWGLNCALVRDLTDTMYNPASPPTVSHDEGTELVVEHIEKYWCPSLTAAEFAAGLPAAGDGK